MSIRRVLLTILLPAACFLPEASAAPRTPLQRRTDDAIAKALEFIASQQQVSGAWKVDQYGESTAATSLAVMSFMAAGHVPGEGPYARNIERGIKWVIDRQEQNGLLVHKRSHGPMYSHGISTLMLAEVLGMVEGGQARRVKQALERAIRLTLDAQYVRKSPLHAGGWRYSPGAGDSDLSVTGWQLLALRAAKDIGCDVPLENIEAAIAYVKKCAGRGNRAFAYQPGGDPTPTRTGTGILALEVCGEHRSPEVMGGVAFLRERELNFNSHYFFYGVYYCSVGMFKVGGKDWINTRDQLVRTLLAAQNPDGSWMATRGSEKSQGPVYATSMAVLALSVEYQYLPIYQR